MFWFFKEFAYITILIHKGHCIRCATKDSNPLYRLEIFNKTKSRTELRDFVSVVQIWLERIDSIKTFDDDPLVLEQDIIDIRQLLDESDNAEEIW